MLKYYKNYYIFIIFYDIIILELEGGYDTMVEYFRLTSSENQYNEFVFGTDSFILEFRYNETNKRYYIDVYKNNKLMIKSLKLVWCLYNIFSSYVYKDIGELRCISNSFDLSATDGVTQQLQEVTKENITKFVFEWRYKE